MTRLILVLVSASGAPGLTAVNGEGPWAADTPTLAEGRRRHAERCVRHPADD
ncbi:hypothetical protein [Endothiovibrio diazotrophicus]